MDYFLKENKKFLIAVGAGLLVAFLYNAFILKPLSKSADRAKAVLQREKEDLKRSMENGVPSEDSLVAARAARDGSKRTLRDLVRDVEFKVPDRFKKPERESAKSYFENQIIDLHKELHRDAVKAQINFPATPAGLGFGDQVSDEVAPEYLQRLAVVSRVVQVAIEAGVDKIEVIDGLAGTGSRDEAPARKSSFLGKHNVFMKFSGKAESVFKVLHGVQRKGQYLAVTSFEALRDDATKDLFAATISVAMLKVDEKAGLEAR